MRLRLEKMVAGALTLARLEDGQLVLVAGGLPGELVEVSLHARGGHLEAQVLEVFEPSSHRVAEPSELGQFPPTADLAFASYPYQLELKHGIVSDALEHIAHMDAHVMAVFPSPRVWHYRAAAQYLITDHGLAYRERSSQHPRVVRDDPLVMPEIAGGLPAISAPRLAPAAEIAFRASVETGEVLASLIGPPLHHLYREAATHLRELGIAGLSLAAHSDRGRFRVGSRNLFGQEILLERFGEVLTSVQTTLFAQVNPFVAGTLYERAAQWAGGGAFAVDLYGGSGVCGLHLARSFDRVVVLEINAAAVKLGALDAERLGYGNVAFMRGDAARLAQLKPELVVLDPPRAGLSRDVRHALLEAKPQRMIYISCNPATWARDVAVLQRSYKLTAVEPFDFYPQTSHVELISLLER